jgi:Xaa-Pro aminopeptidase
VEKLYLLLPRADQDENGKREFTRELDFSSQGSEQKIENARPIFDDLRHIKSPYELKLLQHAIDITTEAQMRSMAMVGRAKWEYEVQAESNTHSADATLISGAIRRSSAAVRTRRRCTMSSRRAMSRKEICC